MIRPTMADLLGGINVDAQRGGRLDPTTEAMAVDALTITGPLIYGGRAWWADFYRLAWWKEGRVSIVTLLFRPPVGDALFRNRPYPTDEEASRYYRWPLAADTPIPE